MYWIVCTFGEKTWTGKLLRSAQSKEGPGTDISFLGHLVFSAAHVLFFLKVKQPNFFLFHFLCGSNDSRAPGAVLHYSCYMSVRIVG